MNDLRYTSALLWLEDQRTRGRHPSELKPELKRYIEEALRTWEDVIPDEIAGTMAVEFFIMRVRFSFTVGSFQETEFGRLRSAWFDLCAEQ